MLSRTSSMPFLGNFERDAQEVISKNGNDFKTESGL
jgi:hypothetical protein